MVATGRYFMADEGETVEVAGWKRSADGERVEIGFETSGGSQLILSLDQDGLRKLLLCAVDGTAAFRLEKGLGPKEDTMHLSANWFELSRVTGTKELS
jgi:hypothetical protein